MTAWRLPHGGLPVPTPPLTDGGILLRHWSAGDAASLSAAWSDPEIARRLPVPDLVTDWALGELGLGALVAEVDRDNAASLRVADRAGYRPLADRPEGRVALVATSADRRGAAGRAPTGGC